MHTLEPTRFRQLIVRIRAGDGEAAAVLLRHYEPEIRREVRLRLKDRRLRRLIDSIDICQSVFGNFFLRAHLGEWELDDPRKVLHLLIRLATNRLTDWARRLQSPGRDIRRDLSLELLTDQQRAAISREPTPSSVVSARELLEDFRSRLRAGERRLFDLRAGGKSWSEIAESLGEEDASLRKRLQRARQRVLSEMDL